APPGGTVEFAGGVLRSSRPQLSSRAVSHGSAMLVKALRPLAVLAGALIVVWLVWEIGISTLVTELRKLSWRLPLILLPQVVTNLFKTEAWRLPPPPHRARRRVP